MEGHLLSLLAFLRPLFFIEFEGRLLGLNVFELAAIGLSGLLVGALLIRSTVHKDLDLTAIDFFMLAFTFWCISIYLIYIDNADIGEVAKLVLPLLTYTVSRNVIVSRRMYERIIWAMLLGLSIPLVMSAGLIVMGKSISYVNYWTDVPRYEGVYAGAHDLSHNAVFALMLVGLYADMKRRHAAGTLLGKMHVAIFLLLTLAAMVCLYGARVRTPILGLLVFLGVVLFFYNKKLLIFGFIGMLVAGIVFFDKLAPRFFYDVSKVTAGEWEVEKLGSNRPNIWLGNIGAFADLPFDRQLAGVGVGNRVGVGVETIEKDEVEVRNSHNDYLEVLIQTGFIGFALFVTIQILLFNAIRRRPDGDRPVLLALFAAVTAMNLVSNSYVTRFGLAQMLYLVLAVVELRKPPLYAANPQEPLLGEVARYGSNTVLGQRPK